MQGCVHKTWGTIFPGGGRNVLGQLVLELNIRWDILSWGDNLSSDTGTL